jgi:hypothetical protein
MVLVEGAMLKEAPASVPSQRYVEAPDAFKFANTPWQTVAEGGLMLMLGSGYAVTPAVLEPVQPSELVLDTV